MYTHITWITGLARKLWILDFYDSEVNGHFAKYGSIYSFVAKSSLGRYIFKGVTISQFTKASTAKVS